MSRVYREMESGKPDSQDGSRLVYVLTQIAKVLDSPRSSDDLSDWRRERMANYLNRLATVEKIIAPKPASPRVHVVILDDGQTEDEAVAAYAETQGL